VGEALEGQVGEAAVLGLADLVLDAGVTAVGQVKLGRGAGLVGEEHREALAALVGERELVAVFELGAPRDQPRPRGPRREVHAVGDLADLGVLAHAAISTDRLDPRGLGEVGDRFADALV